MLSQHSPFILYCIVLYILSKSVIFNLEVWTPHIVCFLVESPNYQLKAATQKAGLVFAYLALCCLIYLELPSCCSCPSTFVPRWVWKQTEYMDKSYFKARKIQQHHSAVWAGYCTATKTAHRLWIRCRHRGCIFDCCSFQLWTTVKPRCVTLTHMRK